MANKKVIIICGPTASGKTSVAIKLAKHFNTEIISADSRQCFKELSIGVARPTEEELREVPHHFIASHSVQDEVTAATFEKYALEKVNELFRVQDTAIMVGGTGLYIKAFCEGLDIIPSIDPGVRKNIIERFERSGIEWLQQEVKAKDPAFYEAGEIQNPQRMMRALEVAESTGSSILHFRKGSSAKRDFDIIKIGTHLPKEKLHLQINNRVDEMIKAGLIEEVRSLHPFRYLNALQTVGYKEIVEFIEGRVSIEHAIEAIKTHTRQFAKRQLTWFKKDEGIQWVSPEDIYGTIIQTGK